MPGQGKRGSAKGTPLGMTFNMRLDEEKGADFKGA